jgi:hypothetical protein
MTPQEIQLGHLQAELARIDVAVRLAVMAWQQAGRDPRDLFRGLVISDDDAQTMAQASLDGAWANGWMSEELRQAKQEAAQEAAQRVHRWVELAAQAQIPLRLVQLARVFGLSPFDVDALLICLAPAVDLRYEQLYSYLQNDISRKRPAVHLILDLLGGDGFGRLQTLNRFSPQAPLLRHRLLEYAQEQTGTAPTLLSQSLQVDRAVVGWLLGFYQPAAEMGDALELVMPDGPDEAHLRWR